MAGFGQSQWATPKVSDRPKADLRASSPICLTPAVRGLPEPIRSPGRRAQHGMQNPESPRLKINSIVRGSGRLQARNCGAPASPSHLAAGLIRLFLSGRRTCCSHAIRRSAVPCCAIWKPAGRSKPITPLATCCGTRVPPAPTPACSRQPTVICNPMRRAGSGALQRNCADSVMGISNYGHLQQCRFCHSERSEESAFRRE